MGKEMIGSVTGAPGILKDTATGIKYSLLSLHHAKTIGSKLDTTNKALYGALIATFSAEVAFETAHSVELVHNVSHANYFAATLNAFSLLAAAVPMKHLAHEVSHDFKKLVPDTKSKPLYQLDYYGMPVAINAKNVFPNDNTVPDEDKAADLSYVLDYYDNPAAPNNQHNFPPDLEL